MPKINMVDLSLIVVPICPEKMMLSINSKVDELMCICDQLKQQLQQSQQTQVKLTDALVDQALA
ncbi:hypothetical protein [Psychrobacter raelei]|uniref:hypothetical protein n=1 Tax=Psychrobacter raelei TaxID=2565531 RepID=UPI003F62F63F